MQIIIFDLDGTLANINHRRYLVEGPIKDWDAFFEACDKDVPNTYIVWLFRQFQRYQQAWGDENKLEIWSGRSESVRTKTIQWLLDNGMYPQNLRMRQIGDYRPDEILKKEWLDEVGAQNIKVVFDDRDKVVKMWRDHGITCLQVAPGNF